MKSERFTAYELQRLLSVRYSGLAYAFMPQVANGTGMARNRTADALVMSLWPSRGLDLHGFEIKVARADWLKELKSPEKAEAICQFCDRWWIVAPVGVVSADELPPTWGWLAPVGGKLVSKREAPALTAKPMTREFLAGLLRKASECVVPKAQIEAELSASYDRGRKVAEGHAKHEVECAEKQLANLKETVAEFTRVSGVNISSWNRGRIFEAVKVVADGGFEARRADLAALGTKARQIAAEIEAALSISTEAT